MERKIGEIFEFEGEWYQCVIESQTGSCDGCALYKSTEPCQYKFGRCRKIERKDCEGIIFKKLEKVREPYCYVDGIYQEYKTNTLPYLADGGSFILTKNGFAIKIKENTEDMETNFKTMPIPDGWEFDRIDDSGNIVLKEKKKELPKTWLKCLHTVNETEYINDCSEVDEQNNVCDMERNGYYLGDVDKNLLPSGLGKPMLALCQLLVCRNAWWKQLVWKPDWQEASEKFVIGYKGKHVVASTTNRCSMILAFPTEDIRDQFLQTFRDLIEEAKELL